MNDVLYANKNVAVLGAGRSGLAAARLLREEGANVTLLDSAPAENLRGDFAGLRLISGAAAEADHGSYDFAVISPGIDPATALARNFAARQIEITGELELAWSFGQCPVIAITGTNGKTTTTELVAMMLNACGQHTVACGNIGKPLSEAARESAALDVLTVEVSSFQLETIRTFRPAISVWLNFAPDHLDRYPHVEAYRAAKLRVFENQTTEDVAIVRASENLPPLAARLTTFSASNTDADFTFADGWIAHRGERVLRLAETNLRGTHNAENLMAALAVGRARGLSFDEMRPALCSYRAQPHRCEIVRTHRGVEFINDSKATNLDALEKALLGETRPVVLIAGGKDKGFAFDSLGPLIARKVRCAVLIGEMAERIARDWRGSIAIEIAVDLAHAVTRAAELAQPGDAVLFSPGTSSFDMFKSYADRGDQFRALVDALAD